MAMRKHPASLQAASTIFLTNKLFSQSSWSDLLTEVTSYS